MRPRPKPKPESTSKSLTLSVLVGNVVGEEDAVPLNIYDPEAPGQCKRRKRLTPPPQCLRRSPRLSPSPLPLPDSPPPKKKLRGNFGNAASGMSGNSSIGVGVRRSPRFTSPVAEAATSVQYKKSNGGSMGSNAVKVKYTVSNGESLAKKSVRKSPKLMDQSETKSSCLKVSSQVISVRKLESHEKDLFKPLTAETFIMETPSTDIEAQHLSLSLSVHGGKRPMPLRRSPRLKSDPENNVGESLKNFECQKMDAPFPSKNSIMETSSRDEEAQHLYLSLTSYSDKRPTPLRRSPRLKADPENNVGQSLKKIECKKLVEKVTRRSSRSACCVDEKRIRRSPRFSPCVAEAEKNCRLNPIYFGLSDSKDEFSSKKILITLGESDSRIFDEKYLSKSPKRATSLFEDEERETQCALIELPQTCVKQPPNKRPTLDSSKTMKDKQKNCKSASFVGDPIPDVEAQERWGWRYQMKSQRSKRQSLKLNEDEEDEIILNVDCHYAQAKIGNCIFSLGDCAYIGGNEGKKHVGRILEFFKTTDGENCFRVQWFYQVEDTVINEVGDFHDKRRLFYSTIMNDNLIDCIISKVTITQISPRVGSKVNCIQPYNFYYDMEYCVDYSTFRSLVTENSLKTPNLPSCNSIKAVPTQETEYLLENMPGSDMYNAELALLDLYCGCGGMSTGLCLGAKLSRVILVTKWALDSDKSACESFKLNHPETQVRNEAADDFLKLLKEWEKLCRRYKVNSVERPSPLKSKVSRVPKNSNDVGTGEYEVSRIVDICYGDPNQTGKRRVNFKVRWKGYSSSEDTWEPIEGLSNCQECIQDFVINGSNMKILPLPGDVDVICGGPPCQGISGYNRFRNMDSPLDDERNHQIVVFMDIVNFLKPKYVLMENVVDILRFDKASLGRYALSRLVHMSYQARLGILAAGCYGLPQFRLRVFLWGARPCQNLPQFPLPTHDVIIRYWPPPEFERNIVAYDEDQPRELEEALVLRDAISDLPAVANDEKSEQMSFQKPPETDFQRYIRSTQHEMMGSIVEDSLETENSLYDHRPYPLFEDDYIRVSQIPKRKGANFRNLPGVVVGNDNVARRDSAVKPLLLPSGKPLVPDYVFTFERGKSKRPFSRLWWDETVPTVLTLPSCHNQAILHPEQDRILTVRECARLQGFPDYYRFCGTIKERYCQVGNAVAVPVARALGYALGLAVRNLSGNEPLMTLPHKFPHSNYFEFTKVLPLKTEEDPTACNSIL